MNLSAKQKNTLSLACEAIVPSIESEQRSDYWRRSSSDLHIADQIVYAIGRLTDREQRDFVKLLKLLGTPFLGLTWRGPLKSLSKLSPNEREILFQRWSQSNVNDLRKSFQTLKKLTCFIYYSCSNEGQDNPNWPDIGYPGPLSSPNDLLKPPIRPLLLTSDSTLDCDTLIIGSGAGGGVMAGELARRGIDVLVVEKGPYIAENRFNQKELEMVSTLYDSGGSLVTRDGAMTIFAGSCLGGGTTVNWSGSFRTPPHVLETWAKKHDNPHFLSEDFRKCFDAVELATRVTREESPHNPQNRALWEGATALGYDVSVIPRNVSGCTQDNCKSCGYCGFGCQSGTKYGTLKSHLQPAFAAGARLVTDMEVNRIEVKNGAATGVSATRTVNGKKVNLKVRAKRVILSAGALHTPAILLRSGIHHPQTGRNLFLHPTSAVAALYKAEMNPWWGVMMSAVSDEFANLNGGYGFKLETPPAHTGLQALGLPWRSGREHKAYMLHAAHVGTMIVLTRDRDAGRIGVDKQGRMRIDYSLSAFDKAHLLRGLAEASRIHRAAGAQEIYLLHNRFPRWRSDNGSLFEDFVKRIPTLDWRPNFYSLFSAHQMGSCRMGGNRRTHPVSPEGRLHQIGNLYVADASVFPESSGANPMLSVQAIAYYIAQNMS